MSNPRELYNQYHKAMMDARIEANKQLQKDAMKRYEIDKELKHMQIRMRLSVKD